MTQTITIDKAKEIAAEYPGVALFPIAVLKSHCLFVGRTNKGRYEDSKLVKMTEAAFRAVCEAAVKPVEVRPVDMPMNTRRRSILTGHFLGGDR